MQSIYEIQGHCQRCGGPVFLNRSDDHHGNTVAALNCWNGHYYWVNVEGIESDLPAEKAAQASKTFVRKISFFKLP